MAMSEEQQNRFNRNLKVRTKYNLDFSEMTRIFGENRAFHLSRADTSFTDGDISKIEAYRESNPGTRW